MHHPNHRKEICNNSANTMTNQILTYKKCLLNAATILTIERILNPLKIGKNSTVMAESQLNI